MWNLCEVYCFVGNKTSAMQNFGGVLIQYFISVPLTRKWMIVIFSMNLGTKFYPRPGQLMPRDQSLDSSLCLLNISILWESRLEYLPSTCWIAAFYDIWVPVKD